MSAFRRSLTAAACLATAASGGLAHGASWRAPVFPSTTGPAAISPSSQAMGLAQGDTGAAALIYRARDRSLRVVQRSSATGAWSRGAGTWLSASAANAGTALEAQLNGTSVWAVWTRQGGARIVSASGTRTRGSTASRRGSSLGGTGFLPELWLGAQGSRGYWGAWLPASTYLPSGPVFGGSVTRGRVPIPGASASAVPTVGGLPADSVQMGGTASGGQVFMARTPAGLGYAARVPGGAWSPATAVSPPPVAGTPFDVAVDSSGNAVMAWVSYVDAAGALTSGLVPGGNVAVVTAARSGASGAFGPASVLAVIPRPVVASPSPGSPPIRRVIGVAVGMSGTTTVVGYVTMQEALGIGPPTAWATRGTIGQALPAPVPRELPARWGSETGYDFDGMRASVNSRGGAALAVAFGATQGETVGLWSTVSPRSTAAWAQLVEVTRCARRGEGAPAGFGDWQMAPFRTGFTIAFQCTPNGTPRLGFPNAVGLATYR